MTIVVAGASGKVGREVVSSLLARGAHVRAMVRTRGRAVGFASGVEVAIGDFADRGSLERSLSGAEGAFFVTPHDAREEAFGAAFIESCEAARVRRLVFASGYRADPRNAQWSALWLRALGLVAGHYRAKLRVEARVHASSIASTVLLPSNFFQNDELIGDAILAGRYAQPIGSRGTNRVDCRDIGDAAARALLDDDARDRTYPLVSEATWTGASCAAIWSHALNRHVRYVGDDLDAWEQTIGARLSLRERSDFRKTYWVLQRFAVHAREIDVARCTALLGRAPRRYEDYARQAAARWSA